MPVIHNCLVLKIVFAQFGEIIAKRLAAGEKLFIATKAAIQRVTAGINNFSFGQDQL
jgi:hypothetical protein